MDNQFSYAIYILFYKFFIFSNPSLYLVLDILHQFGHLIHFGCGRPQLSLGLPTPEGPEGSIVQAYNNI